MTQHYHGNTEGLSLETLMIGGFTCQHSVAIAFFDQREHAPASATNDTDFGNRMGAAMGAAKLYRR